MVREIYGEGIATGQATFETQLPDWEKWDSSHRQDCRLIARQGDQVLGWAALSPVSGRRVYSGVAEVSVYVATAARGRGVGTALLKALIEESESRASLDAASRNFPRKRCQHRDPQVLWVSRSWKKATHRQTRRDVERRAAAGAPKHGSRHLAESVFPSRYQVLRTTSPAPNKFLP